MSYELVARTAVDYQPCSYDVSRLVLRGPKKDLAAPYVALLGGTETYGKFIETPFPALLEPEIGLQTVNLGRPNAGLDMFLQDRGIVKICRKARINVLQIPGAHNVSNRFYAVHPRRNDRFLQASKLLRKLYPEVDFTAFNFTKHLLETLHRVSPMRFETLEAELKKIWLARVKQICTRLDRNIVLLWLSDHPIADGGQLGVKGTDPLFVTEQMMSQITPYARDVVEVAIDHADWAEGRQGLVFSDIEQPASREVLGTVAHQKTSQALRDSLLPLL